MKSQCKERHKKSIFKKQIKLIISFLVKGMSGLTWGRDVNVQLYNWFYEERNRIITNTE